MVIGGRRRGTLGDDPISGDVLSPGVLIQLSVGTINRRISIKDTCITYIIDDEGDCFIRFEHNPLFDNQLINITRLLNRYCLAGNKQKVS